MKHVLQQEQFVARPRDEVFAFFSEAANLERITPPSLRFVIKTRGPIEMQAGTLIDYEIALWSVGFHWQTRIELFEPTFRFVDVQLQGPYRSWRHTHEFADTVGGTIVRDRVEYELPLGPLGEIARILFVDRQLRSIFGFRREVIGEIFGARGVAPARFPPNSRGASHEQS